jgi:hypothetical protein
MEKDAPRSTRAEAAEARAGVRVGVAPLLERLVDYAGTFPPAGLALEAAAENFVGYRRGEQRSLLSRMAVALGDLERLASWARARPGAEALPVTVIAGERFADGVAAATRLAPVLRIEAVEARVATPADVSAAARSAALGVELVGEIALDAPATWPGLLDAIGEHGLRAKLRTGALVPSAIPPAGLVAKFVVACARRDLAAKFTAGLHHALSCERALTYASDSPRGPMYGFVNAYAAAALAYELAADEARVERCLTERSATAIVADAHGLVVSGERVTTAQLAHLRTKVGAFGSCSFEEPATDLVALGWL